MARGSLVSVQLDPIALRRIQARLEGSALYRTELGRAIRETTEEGAMRVQTRAPIGRTFALWASVDSEVAPGAFPLWGKVTADATNNGFRYGWALQASKRIPYRYRHGQRAGRPTRRWFSGARPWIRKRLRQRVALLAARIEARWRG